MKQDKNVTPSGVSRRTVVKGAAWAVPAITVASVVPAYAQSRPPVFIDFDNSTACKIPGSSFSELCYDWGYVLWAVFENTTASSVTVKVNGISVGSSLATVAPLCLVGIADYSFDCNTAIGNTFTIDPNSTRYIAIYGNVNGNSQSGWVEVPFTYTLAGQDPVPASQDSDITGSPWQGSCAFPPNLACDPAGMPLDACGTPCES